MRKIDNDVAIKVLRSARPLDRAPTFCCMAPKRALALATAGVALTWLALHWL